MAKEKKEPKTINSKLNNPMTNYRVYDMSAAEKLLYHLLLFLAGGVVGLIFFGGLFKVRGEATALTGISNIVVFVALGITADRIFIKQVRSYLKGQRDKKLQKQFIDMLEILVTALATGNTMQQSFEVAKRDLRNQYSDGDMIVQEVDEILKCTNNGFTLEESLENFGARSDNEDIENFVNVVSTCRRLGGDFRSVVLRTKTIIGDKIAIQDEINTKLISNKLQMRAMCVVPIALVGMLKLGSPELAKNLATLRGFGTTLLACGLFIAAYIWGEKIMDVR